MPEGTERIAITPTIRPNLYRVLKAFRPQNTQGFACAAVRDEVDGLETALGAGGFLLSEVYLRIMKLVEPFVIVPVASNREAQE